MSPTFLKGAAGLSAAALAFVSDAPALLFALMGVSVLLLVVDEISGVLCSLLRHDYRSRQHREKAFAKCLQYAMIATLGIAASFVAYLLYPGTAVAWTPACAVYGHICATEFGSIWENALSLEALGVKMGPLKPLMDRTRHMFASTTQDHGSAVAVQETPSRETPADPPGAGPV